MSEGFLSRRPGLVESLEELGSDAVIVIGIVWLDREGGLMGNW